MLLKTFHFPQNPSLCFLLLLIHSCFYFYLIFSFFFFISRFYFLSPSPLLDGRMAQPLRGAGTLQLCTLSPRASESTSCLKPLPLFPFPQPSLSTMCAPPLLQILVSIKKMPLLPASWLSQQGAAPTFYLHILSLLKYHGNNFSVKGTKKQLFFRTPRYSRWSWMERSTGLERDAHECEQPSVF